MASFSALAVRRKQIRLRHVVFAALVPMFLFVLWYNERYIFNHSNEEWVTSSLCVG